MFIPYIEYVLPQPTFSATGERPEYNTGLLCPPLLIHMYQLCDRSALGYSGLVKLLKRSGPLSLVLYCTNCYGLFEHPHTVSSMWMCR